MINCHRIVPSIMHFDRTSRTCRFLVGFVYDFVEPSSLSASSFPLRLPRKIFSRRHDVSTKCRWRASGKRCHSFFARTVIVIVILSAVLMNVRLSLFSFKIQTFSIRDYGFQMFLVILALPSFYSLQWAAVPVMIVLYLFLNVIRNSFK